MKVREIMTSHVATAEPDTTLEEIATLMRDEDMGAIPVIEGADLAGIVTDRDIVIRCIAEGKDPAEATAEDVMSPLVEAIEPDAELEEAAALMSEKQIRRLPVLEGGRLIGMLSLGDMAVKQQERPKDKAGSALKSISRGVKHEGKADRPSSRNAADTKKSNASRQGQGIANRDAGEERKRQSRVIPFREQGRRTPRRKTG